jgi:hypothetical protein
MDVTDQNEALKKENAQLYAQIRALSQRLAAGSAGRVPNTCVTARDLAFFKMLVVPAGHVEGTDAICCTRAKYCYTLEDDTALALLSQARPGE